MKKALSFLLVTALVLTSIFALAGCGSGDYPVKVANLIIEKEPKNITVLDPSAADIISFIGYDVKMVGRSDDVDQEWLSIVPSVGSSSDPDINAIAQSDTDIVFASENLSEQARKALNDKGVTVVTLSEAQTETQVQTNYITLGRILGGDITGQNKAQNAYADLTSQLDELKTVAEGAQNGIVTTVCFLYSQNGEMLMMTSGSYIDMLIGYTGAVNTALNIMEGTVDANTLRIANPNYIFCDSEDSLNLLKSNEILQKLNAVKTNKVLILPMKQLNRQGQTAIDSLKAMIEFMYPQLAQNADGSKSQNTDTTTAPAAEEKTVADDYKIKLDDKLSLKPNDENDNVKAMQQRLYDLGYIADKENITGYYGDVSKASVKEFQKKNNISDTGIADNATLKAMFSENAIKAK